MNTDKEQEEILVYQNYEPGRGWVQIDKDDYHKAEDYRILKVVEGHDDYD